MVMKSLSLGTLAVVGGICIGSLAVILGCPDKTASAEERNYMSLAGELLADLEMPRLMNQHCTKAASEFSVANARAFQSWLARNARLFDRARAELKRADRYLALPSTPKEPGLETVDKMLARAQIAVSAMISKNGPEAEHEFCRMFPKYLTSIEKERTEEIAALLDRIERGPHP